MHAYIAPELGNPVLSRCTVLVLVAVFWGAFNNNLLSE